MPMEASEIPQKWVRNNVIMGAMKTFNGVLDTFGPEASLGMDGLDLALEGLDDVVISLSLLGNVSEYKDVIKDQGLAGAFNAADAIGDDKGRFNRLVHNLGSSVYQTFGLMKVKNNADSEVPQHLVTSAVRDLGKLYNILKTGVEKFSAPVLVQPAKEISYEHNI